MSAIARYLSLKGIDVMGYDKVRSPLTIALEDEGMSIHYTENVSIIPKEVDLIIYTPAIPSSHAELSYYVNNGYRIFKRAEILGSITSRGKTVAVAGSHGKTTVTTMITHLLKTSGINCTGFLGGISINYQSNFVAGGEELFIVEADEYDQSFLQLSPITGVITAMDADHLDIYGSVEAMRENYYRFVQHIQPGGKLICKYGLDLMMGDPLPQLFSYSLDNSDADIYAKDIDVSKGSSKFTYVSPSRIIKGLTLKYPGKHNLENMLVAMSIALDFGADEGSIRLGIESFEGIKRRFEYLIKADDLVFIDDYAHHPQEIRSLIYSVKEIFPGKNITVVFQPHLYSRTRDFADEFAASLDLADRVILLDIYPAREPPIEGITSWIVLNKMKIDHKEIVTKGDLLARIKEELPEVLLTVGAGDIDALVEPIKQLLSTENARQ